MGRVAPPEIGDFFWRLHNEKGVDIRLETTACRFEEQHEGITTVCSDGERLDADVVVIGIGTIPDAELAAAAGVRCGEGIFVRSEERRVGKEGVGKCRSGWSPYH